MKNIHRPRIGRRAFLGGVLGARLVVPIHFGITGADEIVQPGDWLTWQPSPASP
jgi:hypothetical protein